MTHRKLPLCALLSLSLFLASCGVPRIYRPQVPETIDQKNAAVEYTTAAYEQDFKAYEAAFRKDNTDLVEARRLRDQMINRIREQIEFYYREYELKLSSGRAFFETASDVVELGLSTSATVVAGEALKSILGAALSGAHGTRLSYTKNYLRDQTTDVIIKAMQGSRQVKLNQIIEKMNALPADKYTFEEARSDLVEFFYAGTLQGALQTLATDSGKRDADAKIREQNTTDKRVEEIQPATKQHLTDITTVRQRFDELKSKMDVTEAKKVIAKLNALNVKVELTGQETDAQIFDKLEEQLVKSISDRSILPKLVEAFKAEAK